MRSKKVLVLGAATVIALLAVTFFMAGNFTNTTNAVGSGPEMKLTVKDGGECGDDGCTVPSGGAFSLVVEIVTNPPDYILAQSFIVYGPNLTYKPTAAAGDVFIWPECNTSVALTGSTNENSVLHGCLTGLLPPLPVSNYAGNMLALDMNCAADGSHEVLLLPEGDEKAGTSGALFKLSDESPVIPKVSNLTITCGEGPPVTPPTVGPTASPTITPTPGEATDTPVPPTATTVPPTDTPSPQLCGDVTDDGLVNSLDAQLILIVSAGLSTAEAIMDAPENADVGGLQAPDGVITSADATLVLQKSARLFEGDLTC